MVEANTGRKDRTASRSARRRQLIDATIESISKNGLSGTTLTAVTKEAGLSHGIVNFYFKSKDALLEETLGFLAREHYEHWHGAMTKVGPDPAKQLAAIIEVDFEAEICSLKKLAVWFAFWGQAKHRPTYLEIHSRYDAERFVEFKRLCTEIVETGGYDGIDPIAAARRIEALLDGIWLNMLLYPKSNLRTTARADAFAYLGELFPRHFAAVDQPPVDGCDQTPINSVIEAGKPQ